MKIRKMTETDAEKVWAIEKETFSDPWSREGFLDALSMDCTCYLVAEENGEICGYCGYYRSFEEAEIVNVAVAKAFRRQGIGHAMLCGLLKTGYQEGVREFFLEVRSGNKAAIGLYASLGFQKEGIRRGFYSHPKEDADIMALRIRK